MFCPKCGCEFALKNSPKKEAAGQLELDISPSVEVAEKIINSGLASEKTVSFISGLLAFSEKNGYLSEAQRNSIQATAECLGLN